MNSLDGGLEYIVLRQHDFSYFHPGGEFVHDSMSVLFLVANNHQIAKKFICAQIMTTNKSPSENWFGA